MGYSGYAVLYNLKFRKVADCHLARLIRHPRCLNRFYNLPFFQVTKGRTPVAKIQVSGVQSVELLVVDKVQLGRSVVAQVKLLDQQGHGIPPDQLKYLQVSLAASNRQIVKLDPKPDSPVEDLLFVVQGSELGLTMITAEVTYGQLKAR